MNFDRGARRLLAVALLGAALLPACNNDDETTIDQGGNTLTDPVTSQSTQIFTQSFPIAGAPDIQHPTIVSYDVAVPAAGSVRVEADWTAVENDIDIVVTKDDCRSGIAAWNADCQTYSQDRSSLTKPARVDFTLSAGATIRVYVYNFSQSETAVVQVLYKQ